MEYLIIFLIFSAAYLSQKEINKQGKKYERKIEVLSHEFDELKEELNELRHEVEYQNLTDLEKEEVAFEKAQDLSVKFFEKLEKGQIISLASGSYYHPDEDIHISKFEYKHDSLDKESKTEYGWKVYGYQKLFAEDEWSSCEFIANDTECSTSDCSGTIKKMH